MMSHEIPHPAREGLGRGRPDLRAKAAQHAPQAHLDIMALGLQKLAGGQKRANLLGRERLAVHRPEPAQAHQLGIRLARGYERVPYAVSVLAFEVENVVDRPPGLRLRSFQPRDTPNVRPPQDRSLPCSAGCFSFIDAVIWLWRPTSARKHARPFEAHRR